MQPHDLQIQKIPLIINGWTIFAHPLFLEQFETLLVQVEVLSQKYPGNYSQKKASKLLAAITKLIFDVIPQDPMRPDYRLGDSLGDEYKHWFRVKFSQQYRLFFRYHKESKTIIYAWVNDKDSLRAYESDDDAYRVFHRMLENGQPPDDWNALLAESTSATERLCSSVAKTERGKVR